MKKHRVSDKIKRALDITELMGNADAIEMRGGEDLTVRGCAAILHYSQEEIKLSLSSYILTVRGEGLYCASYFSGAVCIEGDIRGLEFDKRR